MPIESHWRRAGQHRRLRVRASTNSSRAYKNPTRGARAVLAPGAHEQVAPDLLHVHRHLTHALTRVQEVRDPVSRGDRADRRRRVDQSPLVGTSSPTPARPLGLVRFVLSSSNASSCPRSSHGTNSTTAPVRSAAWRYAMALLACWRERWIDRGSKVKHQTPPATWTWRSDRWRSRTDRSLAGRRWRCKGAGDPRRAPRRSRTARDGLPLEVLELGVEDGLWGSDEPALLSGRPPRGALDEALEAGSVGAEARDGLLVEPRRLRLLRGDGAGVGREGGDARVRDIFPPGDLVAG